ncbi:MAG: ATP-binding protein [Nitrospirota bacterium]
MSRLMRDLSLHVLDVAENSVDAGARNVVITIREERREDRLTLTVRDDGRGFEAGLKTGDAYFTSKRKRFGMGIPMLKQAARETGGSFSLQSEPGRGTVLSASFGLTHVDRKPLGDMGATLSALVAGHPETDFVLVYESDGYTYRFETARLREELPGLPLSVPKVLQYIHQDVNEGIRRAHGGS